MQFHFGADNVHQNRSEFEMKLVKLPKSHKKVAHSRQRTANATNSFVYFRMKIKVISTVFADPFQRDRFDSIRSFMFRVLFFSFLSFCLSFDFIHFGFIW